MKFSLRTAFSAISLLGIVLGMYVEHGLLGIGLLLPPATVMVVAAFLWRKGCRVASIGCLTVYLLAWGATEIWGTGSYEREVEIIICDKGSRQSKPIRRVSYDAFLDRTRPLIAKPWYYVGRSHSPCPLVVYAEYGWHFGPTYGEGGRSYALWCGGWHRVGWNYYWSS